MARPVVGIIGNRYLINDQYPAQATGLMNVEAVSQVADCLPLIVPSDPAQVRVDELMATCDGFVFTGGRPNVHPSEYGHDETPAHGEFDRPRDGLTLPLIRACVAAGLPVLGICRGFQEVAVAFGATLHPEIRDIPGRDNHRMPPDGSLAEKFALRHTVDFRDGSAYADLFGAGQVMVNSLHGQGICQPGTRIVVEGRAPDGTIEAITVDGAKGYALAVQWHPEWNAANDPVSRPLFASFGDAVRAWAAGLRSPLAKAG